MSKHKPYVAVSYQELLSKANEWRQNNETIVFTNGCFDLLHAGHIAYLYEAATYGDRLIVAVNADDTVSKLKGPNRPIKDENQRSSIISSLGMVDACVIFYEETPLQLINLLLPNVLVKGGDWKIEDIVGSETVIAHGGMVKSLRFLEGFSTTLIEQKIKTS